MQYNIAKVDITIKTLQFLVNVLVRLWCVFFSLGTVNNLGVSQAGYSRIETT